MPEQWAREGQRAGELHPWLWEEGRKEGSVCSSWRWLYPLAGAAAISPDACHRLVKQLAVCWPGEQSKTQRLLLLLGQRCFPFLPQMVLAGEDKEAGWALGWQASVPDGPAHSLSLCLFSCFYRN